MTTRTTRWFANPTNIEQSIATLVVLLVATVAAAQNDVDNRDASEPAAEEYPARVAADRPAAYWRFESIEQNAFANRGNESQKYDLRAIPAGEIHANELGPRTPGYPLFSQENRGIGLEGGGYLRVTDPGEASPLDFDLGDSISMEAWLKPSVLRNDENRYIISKGRTNNKGVETDNQNYSLRLRGIDGTARVSFLFRSRGDAQGPAEYHRWTSDVGFPLDNLWHHVAITYTFGTPESIRGYVDGKQVAGSWDAGGPTARGPVYDDDELWIGSALGGNAHNSFAGSLDEVALYRHALDAERIAQRFARTEAVPKTIRMDPPEGKVLVEIVENIPNQWQWPAYWPEATEHYEEGSFALVEIPRKYNEQAIRADRSSPFLLRASADVALPAGQHRLLLRSRWGSRLLLDDEVIAETGFPRPGSDGHQKLYIARAAGSPNMADLSPGDRQQIVTIDTDGQPHRISVEVIVGGRDRRPELGNLFLGIALDGEDFYAISPVGESIVLTDRAWSDFADRFRLEMVQRNNERRAVADRERAYWSRRHELARQHAEEMPALDIPSVKDRTAVNNEIDRFIQARLEVAGIAPEPVVDEWSFLRRLSLDARGVPPTPWEVSDFHKAPASGRRAQFIDQMLDDPAWADHWVGYWQDVLAENPNIVNPTLNNTGPFRWWIYESFLDNKPMDRFATELIRMQGSKYFGGPAGFEMATENDVPMAAKAHILGEAFLGVDMKCARCHDAPNHDYQQRDLFELAAMLKRSPETVPKSSSILRSPEELKLLAVRVTLKPGEKIAPNWPFEEIVRNDLREELLQNPTDTRERLALLITSPENERFARVMVNRLWARLMGRGLVEPVGDWENTTASHPELLEFLAREFVMHGYDYKHVARLIFNSQAYQRRHAQHEIELAERRLYGFAIRRRMQAEQVVDSMFAVAGKPLDCEEQSVDLDAARSYKLSLSLGHPRRAWMFTSTSNERDRPSLALPESQTIVGVLENFGWRGSRQNPLTEREMSPSVLQSAILANGTAGMRITQLSEGGALTQLALQAESVEQLIDDVCIRMLTRLPTEREKATYVALLRDGFEMRVRDDVPIEQSQSPRRPTNVVTWSNHVDPEANNFKKDLEEFVKQGDRPTPRLEPDWRERMSDMVWALLNSPEFVIVP